MRKRSSQPDSVAEAEGMGPASLQEERDLAKESAEMECYRCLLQAGSQLESTLQRKLSMLSDLMNYIMLFSTVLYEFHPLLHNLTKRDSVQHISAYFKPKFRQTVTGDVQLHYY